MEIPLWQHLTGEAERRRRRIHEQRRHTCPHGDNEECVRNQHCGVDEDDDEDEGREGARFNELEHDSVELALR